MNTFSRLFVSSLLLIFVLTVPSFGEIVHCAECGMACDVASKFTGRVVLGDRTLYFCDIGDLFTYLNKKNVTVKDARAEVKNYPTGEWIDARKAYYVHSEKTFRTPMGWGIASFQDKQEASKFGAVMDFDGAAKAVK